MKSEYYPIEEMPITGLVLEKHFDYWRRRFIKEKIAEIRREHQAKFTTRERIDNLLEFNQKMEYNKFYLKKGKRKWRIMDYKRKKLFSVPIKEAESILLSKGEGLNVSV